MQNKTLRALNDYFLGLAPPFHWRNWRVARLAILGLLDAICIVVAYYLSFAIRLDAVVFPEYFHALKASVGIHVVCGIFLFRTFGMYKQVWRHADASSALLILKCSFWTVLASTTLVHLVFGTSVSIPRSIAIIDFLLLSLILGVQRFSWRIWVQRVALLKGGKSEKCFIYGAGSAGELLARHVQAHPQFPYQPVGFIDDDHHKRERLLYGMRILGSGKDLTELCKEYGVTVVIVAMTSAPGKTLRTIVANCQASNVKTLVMPDIANVLGNKPVAPRPVDIADLLRRRPQSMCSPKVAQLYSKKRILVTGAGGSIGSEIVRQLLALEPAQLILLDASEYNLYALEREISENRAQKQTKVHYSLGSVTEQTLVEQLFREHNPDIVFHAAAYKHVPIVERNPRSGILNNLEGTKIVAEAALKYKARNFILVSTDKAVRPTNVMGATKRGCELLIQALNDSDTNKCTLFSAVRFGNVLGSSGSVVPMFIEQIRNGGPLTVTHPAVTRYFMLTDEAVGLVLQAGSIAKGGEIFVLNMGEPVKIVDMARQLILLSGKQPDSDIEIAYTGLREGEKLYEELILDGVETASTLDEIFVARTEKADSVAVLLRLQKVINEAKFGDIQSAINELGSLADYKIAAHLLPKTGAVSAQPQTELVVH